MGEGEKIKLRVIIAGGGTGGHLFPGLAVATELNRKDRDAEILFVTGRRNIESEILSRSGFNQASINVEGLKGRGWIRGALVLWRLPISFFQSVAIIRRYSPDLVLGVGGYSAGPVCLAAKFMGVSTAIHEQNSFPGLTNRLLSRVVDRVFISFEQSRANFPGGSLFLTGNPIRRELLEEKRTGKMQEGTFTILVVGGSQGARPINGAFLEALEILRHRGREPVVIHQTGSTDYDRVVDEYRERGLRGEIMPFIRDMPGAYHKADIVVSRAGASTVSELAALGKPSILVPYPFAANDHQMTNARMLTDVGGAEMLLQKDLNSETLADLLMKYMDDRESLEQMGRKALGVGRTDAARVIVDQLIDMVKQHTTDNTQNHDHLR